MLFALMMSTRMYLPSLTHHSRFFSRFTYVNCAFGLRSLSLSLSFYLYLTSCTRGNTRSVSRDPSLTVRFLPRRNALRYVAGISSSVCELFSRIYFAVLRSWACRPVRRMSGSIIDLILFRSLSSRYHFPGTAVLFSARPSYNVKLAGNKLTLSDRR